MGKKDKFSDNSINIGDNNKIEKTKICSNKSANQSWISKWWWAFVVPILASVIAGIILFFLKMN